MWVDVGRSGLQQIWVDVGISQYQQIWVYVSISQQMLVFSRSQLMLAYMGIHQYQYVLVHISFSQRILVHLALVDSSMDQQIWALVCLSIHQVGLVGISRYGSIYAYGSLLVYVSTLQYILVFLSAESLVSISRYQPISVGQE